MYRSLKTVIVLWLLLAVSCLTGEPTKITISTIVVNPDHHDGVKVEVVWNVYNLKVQVSRCGNHYYTFTPADEKAELRVFTFGHPCIDNGDRVKVIGIYQKVKRVGRYRFYNEIDASVGSVTLVS